MAPAKGNKDDIDVVISRHVESHVKVMLGAAVGGMAGTISMALALLSFGNNNIWVPRAVGFEYEKRISLLERPVATRQAPDVLKTIKSQEPASRQRTP